METQEEVKKPVLRRNPCKFAGMNRPILEFENHPEYFSNGCILLIDRTATEVKKWTNFEGVRKNERPFSEAVVKRQLDVFQVEFLPLPEQYEIISAWYGAIFQFAYADDGLVKKIGVNGEAYLWLKKQGYDLFYKAANVMLLLKRNDKIVGAIMPAIT